MRRGRITQRRRERRGFAEKREKRTNTEDAEKEHGGHREERPKKAA
jgi:hypothetical protein